MGCGASKKEVQQEKGAAPEGTTSIRELRQAFDQVDKSGDGYVDLGELKHCDCMPKVFVDAFSNVEEFRQAAAADKTDSSEGADKKLGWIEIILICAEKKIISEADADQALKDTCTNKDKSLMLRNAFDQVDKNGDGYVSLPELKYCTCMPRVFSDAINGKEEFVEAAGADKTDTLEGADKKLSWKEFIDVCTAKGIVTKEEADGLLQQT